jgi:UDP-N-acetylmuramoyl-tripeptide--D-alanyl-D-alanine ligase
VIPLPLGEVERLCPGRLDARPWADEVTGVEIDSRRISEGDLFVAVAGGADFVAHAFARGAAAALVPDDAHAALAALGAAVRERSPARIVGITGSTGKTSTKDILAGLCGPHARTVATEASYNAELGVPLTLCRLGADTEVAIVELGMRGLGQIDRLCAIVRPHLAVITAIGPVHLELLGSVERVAEAKAEVLRWVELGIVPDEPLLEPFLPKELELRRFSPRDVLSFDAGRGVFRLPDRTVELEFGFTHRYQAVNALAALHAYAALGLPLDEAQRGARDVVLSRWRGEELPLPGDGLLINDCWNANPVSTAAALEHLVERAAGRRSVAVLGGMAELGPDSPRYHREVGEAAARLGIDVVVAVGALARAYLGGAPAATWVETIPEAVETLRPLLKPGDVVLVKGSRAVGLETVAESLAPVAAGR